jgi:membrane-bound metal-dependent hydrolase YbcI (DUF457 family)
MVLNDLQREGSRTRSVAVAFVAGSVLPDIDIVLVPFGYDTYLLAHEAGTHSLVGSAVEASLLAGLLWWVFKDSSYRRLVLAAWMGLLGHIFWDMTNGGEIRFLTPFYDERFNLHLVSMWDPLLMVPLLVFSMAMFFKPAQRRRWAVVTMVVLGFVLGIKLGARRASHDVFAREVLENRGGVEIRSTDEVWCSFTRWRYLTEQDGRRSAWMVDVLKGEVHLLFERPIPVDDGLVAASKQMPVVQRFLRLSDLPVAWVEENNEHMVVHWSDMKFCEPEGCRLSFGVSFDAGGAPRLEFIDTELLRQERKVGVGS